MFSYNFSLINKVMQNRNPHVIVGNVITYVKALLKPFETLKYDLLNFIDEKRFFEGWTFQIMSLEQLLNEQHAVNFQNITIETLNATNVIPLADENGGDSYLGTATSNHGFLVPNHDEMLEATGISDHFVVYCDTDTIAANELAIRNTIDYYKFAGLRYQIRNKNDVIPNDPEPDFDVLPGLIPT